MKSEKETLTRKQLYDLVWSTPLSTLSKKYDLSDSGFRILCAKQNIPLPQAGHWMKLQFKKPVSVSPFTESPDDDETISLALRTEKKKEPAFSITIPEKLANPDPLILLAIKRLKSKDAYKPWNHKGMLGCSGEELDIKVTLGNVDRALLFMDTLIKR